MNPVIGESAFTKRKVSPSLIMLVLLGVLVFVYHFGIGIYYARGLEPLPAFEFLYNGAFLCGVIWWLRAEAKSSPVARVYCEGLLIGMGWLFIIPYHLLKTRGLKGLLALFALIITFVASQVLTAIVYVLSSDAGF